MYSPLPNDITFWCKVYEHGDDDLNGTSVRYTYKAVEVRSRTCTINDWIPSNFFGYGSYRRKYISVPVSVRSLERNINYSSCS